MKQVWLLTKIQLRTVFDFGFILKYKKIKNNKTYTFMAVAIFFILLLSCASFAYSYAIGMTLKMIGLLNLLPELLMAVTCMITIITTIYKVKGTLFGFKDYDLIMSLPVKTSTVVTSRLLLLYVINITFTLIVMIPATIAYGILASAQPGIYAASLLTVLFIPIIPMIVASIIGTIITVIASKFRHSNLVNIIIIFAFLAGIMVFPFKINSDAALGQMTAVLTKKVDSIYPLAGMYRSAVCDLKIVSIALFILISILAFLLFSLIVGMKFKSINTNIAATRTKANYKIGNLEQASPFMALYRKELGRFFSSSLYMMNTAIGMVMMTIGAIATLFMSTEKLAQVMEVPQMAEYAGAFAPILVSMCVAMTFITACSISLEGKNLWILKASPILVRTIFLSKISVNLTITIPAIIINSILITIGIKLSLAEFLILLVMPTAYAFFTAIFGLIINLALPNMNWSTEVTVIKQSAASMIAMFGGLVAVALPVLLFFVLPDINKLYLNALSALLIIIVTLFMYRFLNTKGEKMFRAL